MIDGIAMKGGRIIIPFLLQKQILEQLHSNHLGMGKKTFSKGTGVLGERECRHENTVKQCATWWEYKQMQLNEKAIPYEVPCKPWKVVVVDIFLLRITCFSAL